MEHLISGGVDHEVLLQTLERTPIRTATRGV